MAGTDLDLWTETPTTQTPPADWSRLKELFQAALDRPAVEREAWVRAAAAGDADMIDEVLGLLAAEAEVSLDIPAGGQAEIAASTALFSGLESVGPYRIEAELARGGMGRVFRATRENPRRAAAVKLMYRALHDKNAVRRFEYESQILADLNHPNVAHVYESGTVEYLGDEIPWYAMELVEHGRPLDSIVPELAPDLEAKLELFLQVCDGVHHAHQRGIIHRDLKPANVLVDEAGRVKLIDFGIAKSLEPALDENTDLTAQGEVMGTLAYMSPEQASTRAGALDVRVDVYALGVILYRLCTGQMPYKLDGNRLREAVAIICEQEPRPGPLERAGVPSDLRLVIQKALSKRVDARYDSVAALSADLRRYVAGEPIDARPPSLAYQVRRFAGRHRAVVGAIVVVFVALLVAAGGATFGLLEARAAQGQAERARAEAEREREEANDARHSAEQARDFATQILSEADPWQSREPDITLRKVLERASKRLDSGGKVDARTEVQARTTLRDVFSHLSDHEAAEREARRALVLAQEPELADEKLELLNKLTETLLYMDRADEAQSVSSESLAAHQERYGPKDERTWLAQALAAGVLESHGQMVEARDAYASLVDQSTRHLGPDAEFTVDTLANLGTVQHAIGELTEAEGAFRTAWERRAESLGPKHPKTLVIYQELIAVVIDLGRLDDANEELKTLIAAFTEVLGAGHTSTAGALTLRAMVLRRLERPAEAVPLARESLRINESVHGPDHLHTLRGRNNLTLTLVDAGEHEAAEIMYVELEKIWAGRDADAEGSYLVVAINHAQLLGQHERNEEGIAILSRALTRAEKDYPPEFWLLEFATVHRAKLNGDSMEHFKDTLVSERARALAGLPPKQGPG